jgi:hypothetical protein
VNHKPVNPGIADARVRITHDAKTGGDIPAGVFLMVGQNGQSRYIDIFAGKNHFLHGCVGDHYRRFETILTRCVLTDEFRQGGVFESDGPEQTSSISVDIGDDRQGGPFDFFEDDNGKFSLLLQLGEDPRYLEMRIDFPLDAEYLVRLLCFQLSQEPS